MIDKSPEAIASRREAHRQSVAIAALEGYIPTPENEARAERIINGEIDYDEAIAEITAEIHASRAKQLKAA